MNLLKSTSQFLFWIWNLNSKPYGDLWCILTWFGVSSLCVSLIPESYSSMVQVYVFLPPHLSFQVHVFMETALLITNYFITLYVSRRFCLGVYFKKLFVKNLVIFCCSGKPSSGCFDWLDDGPCSTKMKRRRSMVVAEMEWNGEVDSSLEALEAMKMKWRGNLEEKSIIGKEARKVLGRN